MRRETDCDLPEGTERVRSQGVLILGLLTWRLLVSIRFRDPRMGRYSGPEPDTHCFSKPPINSSRPGDVSTETQSDEDDEDQW